MLQKFEVQGVNTQIDDNLRKYINKKIGGLDKYLSRHSRESAHGEVLLKESNARGKAQRTCEVIIHLPQETIVVKESAQNMFAAVDIVEVKLKQQFQKYKQMHHSGKAQRQLFARLRRKAAF